MSTLRKAMQIIALGVVTVFTASISRAHDWARLPFQATGSLTGKVILPNDPAYAPYAIRCGGAPVQVIQGSGDSPELGLYTDMQSHCLNTPIPDGSQVALPFFSGVFTFTNVSGLTVTGKYYGKLRETETAIPPPDAATPPAGAWLIEGWVCVSGGTLYHAIEDDCSADHYFPARGMTFLDPFSDNVNATTLFLRQTVGVMSRW